jgi:hypothetical protein
VAVECKSTKVDEPDFSPVSTPELHKLLADPMLQLSLLHLRDNPADVDGFLSNSPAFKHFASLVLDSLGE